MKKNVSGIFSKLIEMSKDKRGRAILFFGFYFVFFAILIVVLRLNRQNVVVDNQNDTFNDDNYVLVNEYNKKNYKYDYSIFVDGKETNIKGIKNGYVEKFNINGLDYYRNGTLFYVNDGEWKTTTIPNNGISIIDLVDDIIEDSNYVATTTYESGEKKYVYSFNSNVVSSIVNNTEIDIQEEFNEIEVSLVDNKIDKIEIQLDSYCKATNTCSNNMKIVLNYSDIGEQETIVNPLN